MTTKGLIDFHCHLDLYPEFERIVDECEQAGVYTLAITTTPLAWSRNRDLCMGKAYVRAALGLHPQLVQDRWREIDLWERLLDETRYVGEVGLDAGPGHYRSIERQKEMFIRILRACARSGGKILSVHSVRSAPTVLDLIEEHLPRERGTVVLHWFTGSLADARRAVALGCFFSVNEKMLRSPSGARLVGSLPIDRILTETDGPFVQIADTPLKPTDVCRVLPILAAILGKSVEEFSGLLMGNLGELLRKNVADDSRISSPKPRVR